MVELSDSQYYKLYLLARRSLHSAYVFNCHNFQDSVHDMARNTANDIGIKSLEDANDFLSELPVRHLPDKPKG